MPRTARNPPPPSGLEACQTRRNIPRSSICRILQSSDEIKVPPARRSRRPTRFHRTFCLNPLYFTIDRASEVLKIGIMDTSGPRSSKHYANYALGELRIRNLDTSGPRPSIHYANHAFWELRSGILNTPGRSFAVFFFKQPTNSTQLKRIVPQKMMSTGRR